MKNKDIKLTSELKKQVLRDILAQTDLIMNGKKYTVVEETRLVDMSSLRRKIENSKGVLVIKGNDSDYNTLEWLLSLPEKRRI